jgi:hypothetical protein
MEKKVRNFFKGGVANEVADIEAPVNQIAFLPINVRDTGIRYLHPAESNVFGI